MVPLLILWLGYDERERDGHLAGGDRAHRERRARVQAAYGNVHVEEGLLVGDPGGRRRALRDVAAAARPGARGLGAVRAAARRHRDRAARPVIGAALIGLVAGVVGGNARRRRRDAVRPGARAFLGLSHLEAEATSLLAIVPVALVGAWRQHRYGNVDLRDGLLVGVLAIAGAALGVVVANAVPERALEIGFAGLLLFVAAQLARR